MTEQQSLDLKLQHACALKQQGRLAEAAATLREALSRVGLVSKLRPGSAYFTLGIELLIELADVTARQGSYENALTLIREGLEALDHESGNGFDRLARRLREREAWVLFRRGKSEEAMALASATLGECDVSEDPRLCADLHNTLAGMRWQRGEIDSAIHHLELALGLYGSVRDEFGVANACTNLGVLEFSRGAWQQAAGYFVRSERTRLELGWITGRAANLVNLGLLHMSMGDHAQARWEMKESLRISLASGEALDVIHARIALAHLSIVKSDFEAAAKYLAAVRDQRKNLSPDDLVQSLWLEALVTAEDRGLDAGVEVATQALQVAMSNGVHDSAADSLRTLGILEARAKNYPQAESLLRDSVAESEAAHDPYRASLARMELGMIYDETGRRDDAGRLLNQARGVFEQLGAWRDLERLRSRA